MSSIREQYETVPYPHYVHPLSDPALLAANGRILGLNPPDPAAARVLDIGCGAATNLLGMAARLPGSRFVGLDFSAPDIASAEAIAEAAELENVELHHADLMQWQPDGQTFDYIIAYGFFSWVPDPVKDRLFQVIRACLAPQGIACVSYMTYPGCKQPEALRDLLRLRTDTLADPAEKVTAAHATLDFLDRAWKATPKLPHAGYLRDLVRQIRDKSPHLLLLDDLGVERDPCYLLQFAGWAAEHGLRYLGESEFHTMLPENLPPASARELAGMRLDRLQTEQMIDYVTNRSFRCSLLVGPQASVADAIDPGALRHLCFAPKLRLVSKPAPAATEAAFETATGTKLVLRGSALVAFVRALADRPAARTPFRDLLAAGQHLAGRTFGDAETAGLCGDLLTLYGRNQLVVSALPFAPPPALPVEPRLTRLNLVLARDRAMLVTAMHSSIRLDPTQQALCLLLDGTRTLGALRLTDAGRAMAGELEPYLTFLGGAGCFTA